MCYFGPLRHHFREKRGIRPGPGPYMRTSIGGPHNSASPVFNPYLRPCVDNRWCITLSWRRRGRSRSWVRGIPLNFKWYVFFVFVKKTKNKTKNQAKVFFAFVFGNKICHHILLRKIIDMKDANHKYLNI